MTAVRSGHWADSLQKSVEAAHKEMEFLEARIRELQTENDELYEELQVFKRMVENYGKEES